MNNNQTFKFKIVVIGDGGVGKTSLIKKFTQGSFEKDYIKTIGAQFTRYEEEINGDTIKLLFWDIAGQGGFDFLNPLFYKESRACLIVYSLEENDLGNESFKNIESWHDELKKHCGNIPVVLFANKVDLVDDNNSNYIKIQQLVKKQNFLGFYITSAKTEKGVYEAFNFIIKELYKKSKALSSELEL